jgi:LPS-assembly protein
MVGEKAGEIGDIALMDNPFYKVAKTPPPFPVYYRIIPTSMKLLPPCALLPLAMLGPLLGYSLSHAQAPAPQAAKEDGLQLRPSLNLTEKLSPAQRTQAPTFLQGDTLQGRTELETTLDGNAVLRKADTVIRADHLEYNQTTDQAKAVGNVRVTRDGNVYRGPLLELKVDKFEGYFLQPSYEFLQNKSHGEAARADFIDERHTVIHAATYTTCKRSPGPNWMPDWILRASTISLDNDEEVGVAEGAYLSFFEVPILPIPAISFPLSNKRKTGLLPFTFGVNNTNGTEVIAPFYWNIAPNRDATITPTLMEKRGVDMAVDLRYLEPLYQGNLRLNYLQADRLRDANRWGLTWTQSNTLPTGWESIPSLGLALNINRVSDDNYWRDFPRSNANLTQRLLPSTLQLNGQLGNWALGAGIQKWQTLQDAEAPITPPYERLPQLTLRQARNNVQGFDWSVEGDYSHFVRNSSASTQPNSQRSYTLAQISRPWLAPQGYITPKIQLHMSNYQFDTPLPSNSAVSASSAVSVVPTLSLDSGLVFERDWSWMGNNLLQTLEPRAFYVYTPYHDQSLLPNYDTAANGFNFASIYTENNFIGHDKISDSNQVTLGLTSRLLNPDNGAELLRLGYAQRFRFQDQRVSLYNGAPPEGTGFSDVLLGATVNPNARWSADTTVQFNPKTNLSDRSTIALRYNPGNYRVINAAYRFQRDASEQVDLSWQWPINDLWGDLGRDLGLGNGQGEGRYYMVSRMNYSLREERLVDSVWGIEYDAGCWLGRVVVSRSQTGTNTATQQLMFVLEFVGFTRLGIDPYATLKQNISRYQNLRETGPAESRFTNYD